MTPPPILGEPEVYARTRTDAILDRPGPGSLYAG